MTTHMDARTGHRASNRFLTRQDAHTDASRSASRCAVNRATQPLPPVWSLNWSLKARAWLGQPRHAASPARTTPAFGAASTRDSVNLSGRALLLRRVRVRMTGHLLVLGKQLSPLCVELGEELVHRRLPATAEPVHHRVRVTRSVRVMRRQLPLDTYEPLFPRVLNRVRIETDELPISSVASHASWSIG